MPLRRATPIAAVAFVKQMHDPPDARVARYGLEKDGLCEPIATASKFGALSSPPTFDNLMTAYFACDAGFYESRRLPRTGNRECSECSAGCEAETFEVSPCLRGRDVQCNACKTCGPTFFESRACGGVDDRECTPCRTACEPNFYLSGPCTATADAPCTCSTRGLAR